MTISWKDPAFLALLGWKCAQRAAQAVVDDRMAVIDEAVKQAV